MHNVPDQTPPERHDRLAEERTRLARERTILAHIRTGFASFLFGAGVLGLFNNVFTEVLGGAFILLGVLFLLTGFRSYVKSNRRTKQLLAGIEEPFRRF